MIIKMLEINHVCVYNLPTLPVTVTGKAVIERYPLKGGTCMVGPTAVATLDTALKQGQTLLSEHASKNVLAAYGIPVAPEILVATPDAAAEAASKISFPVVVKACGASLIHKSNLGLVELNIPDPAAVRTAAVEMLDKVDRQELEGILVQPMVRGKREIIVGGLQDRQFGPCVMLGLGSILVEAIADVSFRLAPLDRRDASEMMRELRGRKIFEAFRGEPPVDQDRVCDILIATGRLLVDHPEVLEVDINPLVFEGACPVAVDAHITLAASSPGSPTGEKGAAL